MACAKAGFSEAIMVREVMMGLELKVKSASADLNCALTASSCVAIVFLEECCRSVAV